MIKSTTINIGYQAKKDNAGGNGLIGNINVQHLADKVYKNPGTNVFGLFLSPLYIIRWDLPIYNKVGFAYI